MHVEQQSGAGHYCPLQGMIHERVRKSCVDIFVLTEGIFCTN